MRIAKYRQVQLVVVALAILAILLPYYGPLLDHHFVERQPFHVHIYFGAARPEHTHPYQVSHTHSHTRQIANPALADSAQGRSLPDGIVYMTRHFGISLGLAVLTISVVHAALIFSVPRDNRLSFHLHEDDNLYQ
ncbi:MAG: hypothetical protein ACE5F6_21625, partial [Anaerolineae bacterium]